LLDKFISTHSQMEIKLISTKDQVVHGFTKFLHIKNLNEFKHNREVRLKEGVRTVIQSLHISIRYSTPTDHILVYQGEGFPHLV
jgi:hypothetical protein